MTHATAHSHDHPDFLRHHFDTPHQQFEAGKLGMWLFLATEVLLFGGLFCGYSVWRGNHPELFKYGSEFLSTTLGAVNTAVLIVSSLTMAGAVTMAQKSRKGPLIVLLVLTLAGAATFLVIKYVEYKTKFEHGIFPGIYMYEAAGHGEHADPAAEAQAAVGEPAGVIAPEDLPPHEPSTIAPAAMGPAGLAPETPHHDDHDENGGEHLHPAHDPVSPANAHMFFNIYFMMTGLHGIHVLIGIIMLIWLIIGAAKGRFNAAYFTPVDLGGLYWHVVDLIWIFLFPLFYLI